MEGGTDFRGAGIIRQSPSPLGFPSFLRFQIVGSEVTSDSPPIYLLPGMTAEFPVFSRLLPLLPNATIVDFMAPKADESLTNYAARMADLFPVNCYIVGVSFDGIVAREISRTLRPAGCILISSVCRPDELPPSLRAWRIIGGRNCSRLLKLVGDSAALVPKSIRTNSTMRATQLSGDTGAWHRWATSAVLDWQPGPQLISSPLLKIHGDADTTFPIRYTHPDVVIPDGRHALPVSHPVETATAIVAFTKPHDQ